MYIDKLARLNETMAESSIPRTKGGPQGESSATLPRSSKFSRATFELEEEQSASTAAKIFLPFEKPISAIQQSTQEVMDDTKDIGARRRPEYTSDPNDSDTEARQQEKGKGKRTAEKSPVRKTRRYTIEPGNEDEELLLTHFEGDPEDVGNLFAKVRNAQEFADSAIDSHSGP